MVMHAHRSHHDSATDVVLTKAFLSMTQLLELNQKTIAQILGVSEATTTRLQQGGRTLVPSSKEGEIATLMLRLYRGLSSILGGNDHQMRQWLEAENQYFQAKPINLIKSIRGLVFVVEYVDAMRGKL